MPGSRRTFTYSLTPEAGDVKRALRQANKVLAWACEGDSRIECHGVTGEAVGTITLNLTIVNRDQWACRQLAQDILNYVTWGIRTDVNLDLESVRLGPHGHRGYQHGRSKSFNEPRPPQEPVVKVPRNQYTKDKPREPRA